MSLIARYLVREIGVAVLVVLVAFLGLFAFFDLIDQIEDVGKNGYQLHHALIYVVLTVPSRIYELMPIVVLVGALHALTTLARHSEITVMRAAGMTLGGLARVLGGLGLVFAAVTFVVGEFVAPPVERLAQQWRMSATNATISQSLRSGLWVRDDRRFINIRTLRADRTMEAVRIFRFDDDLALIEASEAASGEFDEARNVWRLRDIVSTRFHADRTDVVRQDELLWNSALTPEVLSVLMVSPERMSTGNLFVYVRHLRENQQDAVRYEVALWRKIAYPFATLVMMALALPFALLQDRHGAVSGKVFAGIMVGIGFHFLNRLLTNLGVVVDWSPALAAALPSLLFLGAAATLLWWVERR